MVEKALCKTFRPFYGLGPRGKVFELEARCLQDFFSFPHKVVAAEVPEEDLCPIPHIKRLRNEGPRAKNENMWRAQLARGAES